MKRGPVMKILLRPLAGACLACLLLLPAGRAGGQARELGEFRERQTATFNSAGHAKANGLEISLSYPRSWRAAEGVRPHIVQNFIATDAPATCNLLIREAAPEMNEAELRASVQPGRAATQAPPNSEHVSSRATTIDGLPATELAFETIVDRAGQIIRAKTVIYITAYRTSLIQLTCLAAGADQAQMTARFDAYQPVFRLVANSLVVHDRWRQRP
ncbi:MAG: hypothetical protein QOG13_2341 [Sphingomonadales bacterium]|nr:hypothetical protein [Sphingomonadales bacterium]